MNLGTNKYRGTSESQQNMFLSVFLLKHGSRITQIFRDYHAKEMRQLVYSPDGSEAGVYMITSGHLMRLSNKMTPLQ